ncbi:SITS-binding protein-like [Aethina tumida]|uniref:SITS-binding protein-like n=1 Tax=Aethina tumida TaxID=116153 RepID=UPI002148C48E|nr:SITS-binding protein-like [Aethina tumida]
MNGYTLVLPDMIGGNGYNGMTPDAELLVRWSQANVFMPAMQFSFLPWEIPSDKFDTEKLIKKTIDLHSEYSGEILKAMNESIVNGTPVNAPIWWIDPLDKDALKVSDEYLLGESILVAPVMDQGAVSRDIYLPVGSWKDGNTGDIFIGPINIENYSAPIDILPYFIKQ